MRDETDDEQGQSYNLAWAEIWAGVEDAFSIAMKLGQATMKDDDCLFLKRDGRLEETYFSWSIIPLVGEDGSGTYPTSYGSYITNLHFSSQLLGFITPRSTRRAARLQSGGC